MVVRLREKPPILKSLQPISFTCGILRVSHGSFDPERFAELDRLSLHPQSSLVPALPGLAGHYVAVSIVRVSLCERAGCPANGKSQETDRDRGSRAAAAGVQFSPIVNYSIQWRI